MADGPDRGSAVPWLLVLAEVEEKRKLESVLRYFPKKILISIRSNTRLYWPLNAQAHSTVYNIFIDRRTSCDHIHVKVKVECEKNLEWEPKTYPNEFDSDQLKASGFKSFNDFTDEPALNTIGFNHDKGAFLVLANHFSYFCVKLRDELNLLKLKLVMNANENLRLLLFTPNEMIRLYSNNGVFGFMHLYDDLWHSHRCDIHWRLSLIALDLDKVQVHLTIYACWWLLSHLEENMLLFMECATSHVQINNIKWRAWHVP